MGQSYTKQTAPEVRFLGDDDYTKNLREYTKNVLLKPCKQIFPLENNAPADLSICKSKDDWQPECICKYSWHYKGLQTGGCPNTPVDDDERTWCPVANSPCRTKELDDKGLGPWAYCKTAPAGFEAIPGHKIEGKTVDCDAKYGNQNTSSGQVTLQYLREQLRDKCKEDPKCFGYIFHFGRANCYITMSKDLKLVKDDTYDVYRKIASKMQKNILDPTDSRRHLED